MNEFVYGADADKSWQKIKEMNQEVWTAELQVRLPLFARTKKRNLLVAEKLKKQMAQENLKAIEYEVASSIQALHQWIIYS